MMKTCLLIRHAATEGNLFRKYIGRGTDEEITLKENARTRSAGEHIQSIFRDPFVVSGPLKRCRQTASLLCPSKSIEIIEELSEIDFGAFEGKTYEELKSFSKYRAWINGVVPAPPDGESRYDFTKRSLEGFYKGLLLAGECSELLITCCGGNIMAIMSHITGRDYYEFQVNNLEGYILRFDHDDETIYDLSYDRFVGGNNT